MALRRKAAPEVQVFENQSELIATIWRWSIDRENFGQDSTIGPSRTRLHPRARRCYRSIHAHARTPARPTIKLRLVSRRCWLSFV